MDNKFIKIESSLNSIKQLSDENMIGVNETSKSVNEISTSMGTLAKLGNENSDNINTLEKEIEKFKTEKEDVSEENETTPLKVKKNFFKRARGTGS
jgi:methyl-accepting chemotaxis protein